MSMEGHLASLSQPKFQSVNGTHVSPLACSEDMVSGCQGLLSWMNEPLGQEALVAVHFDDGDTQS